MSDPITHDDGVIRDGHHRALAAREYVELPESAADRERFRQIAQEAAASLEAERDGLHVITERADGPDLDDLVRLIRYLREHGGHRVRPGGVQADGRYRMEVTWTLPEGSFYSLREDIADEAFFVGPDGTVYDANREAL